MNILSIIRTLTRRNVRRASSLGAGLLTPTSRGRSDRKAIRKSSLCRPWVEALEDRRVLSGIQLLPLGDGTFQLRVDGDAKANQVTIVGHGPGDQTNDYSLEVMFDQHKQTVNHVSEVVIDTAGGADTVLLNGQWAFQGKGETMSGVRSILVNTGGGDDAVKFNDFGSQSLNGIVPGPHIEIDTGNGDDLAWFRPIFHPPTLFAGLELSVRTGGGDDSVIVENLAFAAAAAPASLVAIDTAGGNDVVALGNWSSGAGIIEPEIELSGVGVNLSVATVAAVMDTGNGDDRVSLTGTWDSVSDILINLAGGSDTLSIDHAQFPGSLNLGVSTDNGFDYTHTGSQRRIIETAFGTGTFRDNDRLRSAGPDGNDTVTFLGSTFGDLALNINGGSGHDFVFFSDNELAGALDAYINQGDGNDTVTFLGNTFGGGLIQKVIGGDGNDTFRMDVGDANVDPNNLNMEHVNAFQLDFQGGSGANAFLVGLLNVAIDGELDITATGGNGVDTFTANLENVEFSGQSDPETAAHIRLNGDGGADSFSIAMLNINAPTGPAALHIDVTGAGGNDEVTAMVQDNGIDAHLDVNLGAGEDMFTANILPDTSSKKPSGPIDLCIDFAVHGGGGADTLNLIVGQQNPTGSEESLPHLTSEVMVIFNGEGGADAFLMNLLNVAIGGSVEILEDGGDGADQFRTMMQNVEQIGVDSGIGADQILISPGAVDIVEDGGDGNDLFLTTLSQLNGDGVWKTDYKGGNGNDAFTVTFFNVRAPLLVTADLGLGNDSAVISIIGPEISDITDDDNAPQSIGVNVSGGGGRDSLFLNYLGQLTGNLDVQLDGGDDNDLIDALFNLLGQSTGSLSAKVLGGKGNDNLGLYKYLSADSLDQFVASIDGGDGVDKAKATPNVTVNNCEK